MMTGLSFQGLGGVVVMPDSEYALISARLADDDELPALLRVSLKAADLRFEPEVLDFGLSGQFGPELSAQVLPPVFRDRFKRPK
jgi:hypothetical protein